MIFQEPTNEERTFVMGYVDIVKKVASDEHSQNIVPVEETLGRYSKTLRSGGFSREYILGHTARDAREWYPNDPARCAALVAQVAQHFQ